MRIIHTADLHLDSRLSLNLSEDKARIRRKELLESFSNLVLYARKNKVECIIIAGDMFDKEKVSHKAIDYVTTIMNENKEIDFLYVPGNHDENLDFGTLKPDNLIVFPKTYKTISYKECNITGIAYNELNKLDIYSSLALDKNKKNIVSIHGPIAFNPNDGICINMLQNKGIDYLALGHIHTYSSGRIDSRGIYAYSGCLEGRGFDEAGPKGFILLDIDKDIKAKFIKFNNRELFNIEVDISGATSSFSLREMVRNKINSIDKRNMLNITLVGSYTLDLCKNLEMMQDDLNKEYYLARINDKSRLNINPMDYKNDKSLKGEFIRMVLSSNESDIDKEKIINLGIRAMVFGE